MFESLVSRGKGSRFAIEGKREHVDMSTHKDLARLTSAEGVGRIFFDQCVFGAPTPKTSQIIASSVLLQHLTPRFSEKFCGHLVGTHNSIVGKSAEGTMYRTRAAQSSPSNMNTALADSLLALFTSTAAALRDAGGVDEICSDDEHSDNIRNLFDESDAGDIELVMGLKTHGNDNPTWAQAMRSDEANRSRDAARTDMQNF
eukprot:6188633-Pleurochrysis_carterae.AAC.2